MNTHTAIDSAERAPRFVTTLLVGKLLGEGDAEHPCRIRNISAMGMLVEAMTPISTGTNIAVELRSGERLEGSVAWSNKLRAGVGFTNPVDVDRILAEAKAGHRIHADRKARAPRFDICRPARLTAGGRAYPVVIENLSQTGARLRMPSPPDCDGRVALSIPALPPRPATIRWSGEDMAGIAFNDMIPYREFATWLGVQIEA